MKKYIAPEAELVKFLVQDVILVSLSDEELGENETPPSFINQTSARITPV